MRAICRGARPRSAEWISTLRRLHKPRAGNKILEMAWVEDMSDGTASRTDVLRASPPMFDSRLLDFLSRVHPAVPVLIFTPAVILLAAWELASASVVTTLALTVGGYALWTLFEYWLHRIVFHFEPRTASARACTGSSMASTTTTRTIPCAW